MIKEEIYKIGNISEKAYGEIENKSQKFWVKNVIEQESILLSLKKDQKFYIAEEIIIASENRISPICAHFPQCGGCQLQHLDKQYYREFKSNILRKYLEKSGYEAPEKLRFFDISQYSRKKASFVVNFETNPVQIGFQTEFSHQVIDIKECFVIDREIFRIMYVMKENFSDLLKTYQINRLTISKVSEKIDLIFHHQKKFDHKTFELLLEFAKNYKISRISSNYKNSIDLILELDPIEKIGEDYKIKLTPNFFMQSSTEMEEIIFETISKVIEDRDKILDLYSGFGFLTMKFAQLASVKACELSPVMVKNLREAAVKFPRKFPLIAEERDLDLNPVKAESLKKFDHIIANPPYKGFYNQVREIAKANCRRVSVISCNPASFARDAYYLKQAGYRLENIMIIDQFLYSSHLELLALFVKS